MLDHPRIVTRNLWPKRAVSRSNQQSRKNDWNSLRSCREMSVDSSSLCGRFAQMLLLQAQANPCAAGALMKRMMDVPVLAGRRDSEAAGGEGRHHLAVRT